MITNIETNTSPILFHAPGAKNRNDFWTTIKTIGTQHVKTEQQQTDLEIITWGNQGPGCFGASMSKLGQKYTLLGKEIKNWQHSEKLTLISNFLTTVNKKYILGADANDVVCTGNVPQIMKNIYPYKLIFNAETLFWPKCSSDLQEYEANLHNTRWKYLNAGLWAGETDFCLEFFQECQKIHANKKIHLHSDQHTIHIAFSQFKETVGIDYQCKLFQVTSNLDFATLQIPKLFL